MTRKWATIIIITVVTLALWTGWEIWRILRTEKKIEEFSAYVAPISEELDTSLVEKLYSDRNEIFVREADIAPETTAE